MDCRLSWESYVYEILSFDFLKSIYIYLGMLLVFLIVSFIVLILIVFLG